MKHLNKNTDINEMLTALNNDGVFIIDNYLNHDSLQRLHKETMSLCSEEGGHYEFGRNYRGPNLNSFNDMSAIKQTFNVDWMKDLHKKYHKTKGVFGYNVFATHDYIPNPELAPNGWLHFDQIWYLKFFIYLTDIDRESGAFYCCNGSVKRGHELRINASKKDKFPHIKNKIETYYKNELDKFPIIPVEAKAGTLIVFDTDTFHKGGIVQSGKERLVVRLHCK